MTKHKSTAVAAAAVAATAVATAAAAGKLRRRAEVHLDGRSLPKKLTLSGSDAQRHFHELQVHQIELELQNQELQETRSLEEKARARYSDLFECAPVGYLILSQDGRIVQANVAATTLLGVDPGELSGKRFTTFIASSDVAGIKRFLQLVFEDRVRHTRDVLITGMDRIPRTVQLEAVRSVDGRECRVVVSDVTKRMLDHERDVTRGVLLMQEEERNSLSRELHDVVTQSLISINLEIELLKLQTEGGSDAFAHSLTKTQLVVSRLVGSVQRFSSDLRPASLDDLGLIPALQTLVDDIAERTKLRIRFSACAAVEDVGVTCRTVLYRVAREALINVIRHAKASQVELRIRQRKGSFCLEIRDDGCSFSLSRGTLLKKYKHLGLLCMRERLAIVGGTLTIDSVKGTGTTISACIPEKTTTGGGNLSLPPRSRKVPS